MFVPLSSKKIILISFLVFLLGTVLTSVRYQIQTERSTEALEKIFQAHSVKAEFSLERVIQRELQRVESLAMVFKLTGNVSREAFEQHSKVLLASENGVHALEWVEVVEHKNRERFERSVRAEGYEFEILDFKEGEFVKSANAASYAVVNYLYPFENSRAAFGVNAFSTESSRVALAMVERTKDTVVSPPFKLIEAPGAGNSILFYHPVYRKNGAIKGYVGLILKMQDFMDFLLKSSILEPSLNYQLRDMSYDEELIIRVGPDFSDSLPSNLRTMAFNLNTGVCKWQLTTQVDLTKIPSYQESPLLIRNKSVWLGLGLSLLFALFTYHFLHFRLDQKREKKKFEDQELRYEDLIEQSSDAFFLLNSRGDIVKVNSQSAKGLGYSKKELLGMNITQIDVALDASGVQDIFIDLTKGDKRLFESEHRRKDGSCFPVEISAARFLLRDEVFRSAFARDLSDRVIQNRLSINNTELQEVLVQYTHELAEQKKAFETVFEKSADGIFIYEGRRILACNEATVDLFGFASKADLLASPIHAFAPKHQPDGQSSLRKGFAMLQYCLKKGHHRYEWVNQKANGDEFWSDVVLTRIEYYGRPVVHIAFRDITQQKKLEAEMFAAKETALQANQSKLDFLAKMSHEIRTPLHGILSYTQMGMSRFERLDSDKVKRYCTNIEASAQKLMRLFDDLFDASKLEGGVMRFDFTYQNIQPVIQSCIQEQAVLAENKQIEIRLIGHAQMAYFDPARISQVMGNLLSNAVRLTAPNKRILVKIERLDSTQAQVTVSDEGPGVLESELVGIFNEFVQSRQQSLSIGGTGLGLAISREIISAHRGKIWVENRVAQGSVVGADFKFTLPIRKEHWANGQTSGLRS